MKHASTRSHHHSLNLTPLAAALLACFSALAQQTPAPPQPNALPDLGSPAANHASIRPGPNGVTFANSFEGKSISVTPEYSDKTGWSVSTTLASMLGDKAAVGVLLNLGSDKKEWLVNAGFKLDEHQRFIVTVGQLEQFLDYAFRSGTELVGMKQTSGALNYQLQLGAEFLRFLEVNGYVAQTASRELAGKTFAVDTATLYELWNDPRRIAGGSVTGVQARLGFTPFKGSMIKVSLGQERLSYDLLAGRDNVDRFTGGLEWVQQLGSGFQFKMAAESYASQSITTLAMERSLRGSGGQHNIGLSLIGLHGRNGLGHDNQLKLTYTYLFGAPIPANGSRRLGQPQAVAQTTSTPQVAAQQLAAQTLAPSSSGHALLGQVAIRPSVIPSHVVAKVDHTALPTRLIAVDKTALPTGANVNPTTGDVTAPLGTPVTGIAGVTKNLAAFVNTGQFSLVGNNLVIKPNLIEQPAVGVVDTYVVTVNNQGGGTTLATILISHGSVKLDSITVTSGVVPDTTAPVTASAPSVAGTTHVATTLSATLNEAGTGYYLVQPAAAAAPTVAQVQAGTAFAMTANTAATQSISGLKELTAYKIYFVAKDAAGNVQAAVQSVAVTTTAAPDVTAPTTTAAPSVSGTTHNATTLSVTINEAGTGYYLVKAAGAAVPTVAEVQAGTSFAMAANTVATQAIGSLAASTAYTIYFVAKDATGNVQIAVQSVVLTTTAAPAPALDVTAPTTTAAPSVSGTSATATALSVTINEAGTGYYLVQPAAAAAPSVAAVQAGTAFAMAANTAATQAISGLTALTAYKIYFVAKDTAGNVQAAVQSVAVTTTAAPAPALDVTAPATTAAPSVSGTSATTTTLSVTINEAGTGYYLVQPAAAAAPSVAAVQAGTAFTMAANTAATQTISGLTALTAYKIYFVAKDTAGNVQAAVQSVAVTTTAAPAPALDVTAPATTAAPSVSGTSATATTLSVTINEAGTGYYLVQPASAAAPTVAQVQAGTAFAMTANTAVTQAISGLTAATAYKIYFVAKDAANNVQAAVQNVAVTTAAAPVVDVTAPTTTVAPSVSGTSATATTLSVTINETGTGYYLVQAAAAAAPTVAQVQAGTTFAMTANTAATQAISGLTALTAYKIYFVAKDAANNVQAAVQSVAVTTTAAPDITAPTTTAAPSVSGTSATATTLSVTINETGTGYYLVQAAAAAAPTLAQVQAGTAFAMTANTAATQAISGLTALTAYKIYFVAKDTAGNVQAAVQTVAVTTTAAPDLTAPTTTVAPSVSGTSATATTLSVTINEAGTGYYLVQPAAAATPTVAQVQAGTSFAMTANTAATQAISGLTASTAYKIYFVAKDAANNVQAAVQSVAVTTTAAPDITAPTTIAAPSVSGTSATATTLSVTINEAGTGYYLVQAAAAAVPTVAQVQAGTAFAMTANTAATQAISGLTALTAYKIYFVAKDATGNVQAAVQNVAVTTNAAPDVTAPTTTAAPSVSGTTHTATTLSVTINEAGTGYYLVKAASAAAPTVAEVQAGTAFAMAANTAATQAISGLTALTAYKVYFVAKDTAGNVQAAVQSVAVTTTAAPDVTAPTTTAAPSVSGTSDTATTLSVTINEAGTGYYLVQPAAAAVPSVAAVQAGTAFAMTANTAATQAISGLTALTAYKIYFVAKDAAGNVQAAVQNVAVTTTAAPDLTAPTTTVAPSVSGTSATATTLSVTINEAGTGYYLVKAASAAAPTVAEVQAGTAFAMNANTAATQAISGLTASTAYKVYFVAKDAAGNVQATVQNVAVTTTAAPDITAPTTIAAPSVSSTSDTATTLSVTINETGTGYYLVQAAAAAAPTVAQVQAGTAFAMTSNTAATQAISGLIASTAYKIYFVAKDAANNVQAAVQNVAVITTAAPDVTAPTTTAAPSVSGTSATATTLSVTINEAGTGYYLVQPAAAAAPSVAAVQAGTAFAMTANTAATQAISGLTASTAYKIYFVAKDAAGNVQAAVQSVAVTTTATPDVTAPTTTAAPSVSGTTHTATTLSVTINEAGTGYYLMQPAAAAAPTVAAVQAGTAFAMTANTAATQAISGLTAATAYKIYFVAKDAANNVQAAVQNVAVTTAAAPIVDVTAPTTTAAPSVSGTTDTATTLSAAINEAGTGYYLVQAAAAAAPTVAAVQAGTAFAMTANTAATQAISGLTASTAYKIYFVAKDAAGNVQAAVQSVAVTTTAAPDVTAPTTTAAPSVSGTTDTATTLSVTINEAGTGYYLVQAAAAAAPSVAAVQAGTAFAMTANTAATQAISGLTASTAYKIYFVAKDAANNVQAAVQNVAVTTAAAPAADVTAPTTTAAPSVSGTTHNATTLSVTINEVGTGYYLVKDAAAATPTVAEVQAGTAFAMAANTAATQAISGLTAATDYKIYFIAKDAAGNVQEAGKIVAFTTAAAPDVTAPTTTVAPKVAGTSDTATTLAVSIDEAGTGYYLVKAAAAAAPTVAEVQAGTAFAMAANTVVTQDISGLAASTDYKIYFVAKDAASNVQAAVQYVAFTTTAGADLTPPTTTVAANVYSPTDTEALLAATINEAGTGYYLVKAPAAAAPTVAEVQAGTSFMMLAGTSSGKTITGLTASTAYKVYFVAKDTAGNVQTTVQSVAFTTTAPLPGPDLTPPTTTVAANVYSPTDTEALLAATINEAGTGYYLVKAPAAAAPTVAEVQAGTSFMMLAGTASGKTITGLTASTAYKVYFVAKDTAGNVQTTVQSVAFTTTAPPPGPDLTPPTTTGAPNVYTPTDTTALLAATINEDGTGYYLVKAAAAAAPTVAEVQAGTSFTMIAGTASGKTITGLTASTAYKVYFVAKDTAGNVQTTVQSVAFTTTAPLPGPDLTPPTTTAAPSVFTPTDTTALLAATINEDGTGYYLVKAAAAAAPTVAEVQAGTSFTMLAGTASGKTITGLTASTAYKVYFVAKDTAGNVQATVQSVAFTTTAAPDVTAPTTTAAPSASGTSDTATTLSVTINEAGTGYYLVKAAAAAAPTVAEVQAGTAFAMTANTAATQAISGLTASTAYKIFFVAKDAAGNGQAAVQSVAVTTTGDITAPTTTAGPSVSGTTDTETTFSVTINEDGRGYYRVQAAAFEAPTVAEVQAGSRFEMFANKASVLAFRGMRVSTAYKAYFVAKDAANNVQAAVQSVAFTTTAAVPDVTPPSLDTAPFVYLKTDTTITVTASISEAGTGYYLLQAAGAPAPSVAAVMAGTALPLGTYANATHTFSGLTASTAYEIYFVAKDTAGNVQETVSAGLAVTTMADTTPNAFDIANLTNQVLSTVVTTNAITVAGISAAVTASTTVGTLVKNSVDTGLASTSVVAGDTVAVKLTTSGAFNTAIDGTLTIGTGATNSDSFSVTTLAVDTIPDAFAFTDVTGQSLSTLVESNAITVAGINTTVAISVTGGEYSINGGAFTNAAGTVNNGQTVKVRHTTLASNGMATNTVLTIGGVTDTFTSTTVGSLPAGYISQGGLIWMPNNIGPGSTWNTANTYCSTATINGLTGWRLPTQAELSSLYYSGALAGQGWRLSASALWASTQISPGYHVLVSLANGIDSWDYDGTIGSVTCVR